MGPQEHIETLTMRHDNPATLFSSSISDIQHSNNDEMECFRFSVLHICNSVPLTWKEGRFHKSCSAVCMFVGT